ncbi:ABC transporter ATP-binding protein [Sorangium cellulosum]|uniref:Bacitracin ABC transporter ATP-binding protein n=1 Tax=Sorangium cellulosum TaxID=56 RepID=A0A150QFV3_SORCE|nr:ABC transporter ATP-binding protein [Sorangium cellulosum]KYF66762.1 bacitracin ABC transporter ATP-binding protein [Sorangium cellulosum]
MKKYLEIWNITKTFPTPDGPAVVVRNFDLNLRKGEFLSLIGHSGCGKSTVLSMVAGLSEITSGGIVLAGRQIRGPGPDRGVVFQSPCLLHWMTALDNVLLGVEQVHRQKSKKDCLAIATHYLELVGLGSSMHEKPRELSSGMQQRVGLARAFALSPRMLLLDEPFGMLDPLARFELQEVLMDLWAEDQKTALMVTHDVDEALFLSDRIAMMTSGPGARVSEILAVPFPHPRDRNAVLEDPMYYPLRERLITFLESQSHKDPPAAESAREAAPAAAAKAGRSWTALWKGSRTSV